MMKKYKIQTLSSRPAFCEGSPESSLIHEIPRKKRVGTTAFEENPTKICKLQKSRILRKIMLLLLLWLPCLTWADDDYFLKAVTSSSTPYVQSQLNYTIYLYFDRSIQNANLTVPDIEDATVFQIGNDTTYQKTIKGKTYHVLERHYALIPLKSGPLTIHSPLLTGTVLINEHASSDYFSTSSWKPIQLTADSIKLNVQPIPDAAKGHWWLPAKKLELTESWSEQPPTFYAGKPITRNIHLKAWGLSAEQLPEIQASIVEGMQTYPDKTLTDTSTEGDLLVGDRIESVALIPNEAGKLTLPAISVSWWNTTKNRLETATLKTRTINVKPGIADLPNKTSPSTMTTSHPQEKNHFWLWVSLGLFVAWLFTLLLWQWTKRKPTKPVALPSNKDKTNSSSKALKQACKQNNPQAAKKALIAWGQNLWPDHTLRNLSDLENVLDSDACRTAIKTLAKHIYASSSEIAWDGAACWNTLKTDFKPKKNKAPKNSEELPPLYPKD